VHTFFDQYWNKIHPSPERSKRTTLKKKKRKGKQNNTSEEAFIPKSKPNPLNYTLDLYRNVCNKNILDMNI
jgi:hypothetical protein